MPKEGARRCPAAPAREDGAGIHACMGAEHKYTCNVDTVLMLSTHTCMFGAGAIEGGAGAIYHHVNNTRACIAGVIQYHVNHAHACMGAAYQQHVSASLVACVRAWASVPAHGAGARGQGRMRAQNRRSTHPRTFTRVRDIERGRKNCGRGCPAAPACKDGIVHTFAATV